MSLFGLTTSSKFENDIQKLKEEHDGTVERWEEDYGSLKKVHEDLSESYKKLKESSKQVAATNADLAYTNERLVEGNKKLRDELTEFKECLSKLTETNAVLAPQATQMWKVNETNRELKEMLNASKAKLESTEREMISSLDKQQNEHRIAMEKQQNEHRIAMEKQQREFEQKIRKFKEESKTRLRNLQRELREVTLQRDESVAAKKYAIEKLGESNVIQMVVSTKKRKLALEDGPVAGPSSCSPEASH